MVNMLKARTHVTALRLFRKFDPLLTLDGCQSSILSPTVLLLNKHIVHTNYCIIPSVLTDNASYMTYNGGVLMKTFVL
jgi:hypothetical protein